MTELPNDLSDRPESMDGSIDLLSHVLGQIRLTGDGIHRYQIAPGDLLDTPPGAALLCVVIEGGLHIENAELGSAAAETGDLLMLPHGGAAVRLAAGDAPTTVVLCLFRFDTEGLKDMMSALPQYIRIGQSDGAGWLEGIVHFLLLEASDIQPGAALMVSRLIDLAVIRTLRSWIHRGSGSGWFGGLSDPRIANSLKAIHERPMQRWSIEALAAIAGMSRSNFCDRFSTLVGRSPLRYQNEHRLALARDLLADGNVRIGKIALSIGYESEAAFSRAYKSQYGHSPRDEHRLRGGA